MAISNKHSKTTKQSGLSLIELMVAMVIGMFLILGVTQIYVKNQKSYLFQTSQSSNQENGRFTLAVLEQELSKAGYRSLPSTDMSTSFPAASGVVSGCIFVAGASVAAISNTQLCIRYEARNKSDVDCLGDTSPTAMTENYSADHPTFVEKIALDSTTHSVVCTTATKSMQLATGIRDLRFEYGTGDRTVTAFSSLPSSTSIIGAVRYAALLYTNSTATLTDNTTAVPPALTEWNALYSSGFNDYTQIYQIARSTIMLRNQMP